MGQDSVKLLIIDKILHLMNGCFQKQSWLFPKICHYNYHDVGEHVNI